MLYQLSYTRVCVRLLLLEVSILASFVSSGLSGRRQAFPGRGAKVAAPG